MKNILFLLSLFMLPLYASEDLKKHDSQKKLEELLEDYKNELIDLETFLNDDDVESQPTQTQQQKKFLYYHDRVPQIIALDTFIGTTERPGNRCYEFFK